MKLFALSPITVKGGAKAIFKFVGNIKTIYMYFKKYVKMFSLVLVYHLKQPVTTNTGENQPIKSLDAINTKIPSSDLSFIFL